MKALHIFLCSIQKKSIIKTIHIEHILLADTRNGECVVEIFNPERQWLMTPEAPPSASRQPIDYEPAYINPRNPQDTKSRSYSGTWIGPDDTMAKLTPFTPSPNTLNSTFWNELDTSAVYVRKQNQLLIGLICSQVHTTRSVPHWDTH